MSDVLDRIGAANPVRQEAPDSAWTASTVLDEIDARRGRITKIDEIALTPVGSPRPIWGVRIAVAAAVFVSGLAVVGVISWITNGGASELVGSPPTPPNSEVPQNDEATAAGRVTRLTAAAAEEAQHVAESFYGALLRGDWEAANEWAHGGLISGSNVNQLWQIDLVDIRCEDAIGSVVSCTSTQADAFTRQVSDAYGWQSMGRMTVVDGLVTHYTTESQPDPVFDRYHAWLDLTAPGEWDELACGPGRAVSVPGCVPIYLSNVETWLETAPHLGEIAAARRQVLIAEAFYLAYLEGDLDSALELTEGWEPSDWEDVNVLWGIEVVGIDCEPIPAGMTVTCIATQIDDLTRHISPAYTHSIRARIDVVDGVVTDLEVGFDDGDSGLSQYETWLDIESPDGWLFLECSHGGWGAEVCVSIYLDNFEAWLATDPDLGDIEG